MSSSNKQIPNKIRIELWNRLVDEVFNHSESRYSLFVYEMLKRRILGKKEKEYRATDKSDKKYGIKNIK